MLYLQNKYQEEINELQAIKSSLQSKLIVEKDKACSSKAEKEAIEDIVKSECSLIAFLRNEISQLKVCLMVKCRAHDCTSCVVHSYNVNLINTCFISDQL